MRRLDRLIDTVQRYDKIALAYSGGVDSTFLLYVTKVIANRDVVAFTGVSVATIKKDIVYARRFAKSLGVRHIFVKTKVFGDKRFIKNLWDRCFICKSYLFSEILRQKKGCKFDVIFDGTNCSDRLDFRPGNLARSRFGVLSPLEESGFTKEEIRRLSKRFGIDGWDRVSDACIVSRIPYGVALNRDLIKNIASIEEFIQSLGISTVRLRHHSDIARIETSEKEIRNLLLNKNKIVKRIKSCGYKYVTIDLEGYRTGSMNL